MKRILQYFDHFDDDENLMSTSNSVADEECYPYQALAAPQAACRVEPRSNSNLKTLKCNIPDYRPTENLYKMGPAYSLYNETDIMYEIKNYGPVQGEMSFHDIDLV